MHYTLFNQSLIGGHLKLLADFVILNNARMTKNISGCPFANIFWVKCLATCQIKRHMLLRFWSHFSPEVVPIYAFNNHTSDNLILINNEHYQMCWVFANWLGATFLSFCLFLYLKNFKNQGACMAPSVKCPALGFSSGRDRTLVRSSPASGSTLGGGLGLGLGSTWRGAYLGFSLLPSLCPSPQLCQNK